MSFLKENGSTPLPTFISRSIIRHRPRLNINMCVRVKTQINSLSLFLSFSCDQLLALEQPLHSEFHNTSFHDVYKIARTSGAYQLRPEARQADDQRTGITARGKLPMLPSQYR